LQYPAPEKLQPELFEELLDPPALLTRSGGKNLYVKRPVIVKPLIAAS